MSNFIDPTKHRISEHFMLSDFMGCDSVYHGVCGNRIRKDETTKLDEISNLCNLVLEPIIEKTGSISITYGHISDQLSRRIIKYQDPTKPSYHRWDLGAAVDFIPHESIRSGAPALFAARVDETLEEYARMIVYSESPCICIATSLSEGNRRAFYENRFNMFDGIGSKKPQFIRYSYKEDTRLRQIDDMSNHNFSNWRGEGYPTYHGGGRRQFQHIRISEYSVLSDYLYSRDHVHNGIHNKPQIQNTKVKDNIDKAGEVYDLLVESVGRCSIVKGYVFDDPARNYEDRWVLDIIPPESVSNDDIASILYAERIKYSKTSDRVIIWG